MEVERAENDDPGANNKTEFIPWLYNINTEDTNWIITSAFMIFTMQTGMKSYIVMTTCNSQVR